MQHTDSYVERTLLKTPQPTATSTVQKPLKKRSSNSPNRSSNSSLGIISLDEVNISKEFHKNMSVSTPNLNEVSLKLAQQRSLANSTLQRASVARLPSKYLQPNGTFSESSFDLTAGSSINESDLLKTPFSNSTPRNSFQKSSLSPPKKSFSRMSMGKSMTELSRRITSSTLSLDKFYSEIQSTMAKNKEISGLSDDFEAVEDAVAKLAADEMSWKRHNDLPVDKKEFSASKIGSLVPGEVSIGEFFRLKSETLSKFDLECTSNSFHEPLPLVEITDNGLREKKSNKSLSVSSIARILSETDETPRKVAELLFKHGKTSDVTVASEQVSLPVSKNSSYTSNYSQNDALRLVSDKENLNNMPTITIENPPEKTVHNTSSSSQIRSSSRLTNLPDGILPIGTTKSELIWGCIKVDRCDTKTFVLKNKSSKSLMIQLSIAGPSFKIRKENNNDSDLLKVAKFHLYANESKSIAVSFIPSFVGPAIDELVFTPADSNLQQTKKQCIRMYGYGGHGLLEMSNFTKDLSNKGLLNMGLLVPNYILKKSITIKNTGVIPCFALLAFVPKNVCYFANVTIACKSLILNPQEKKEVFISLSPTHEDLKKVANSGSIIDIGMVRITHGTEINRARLKRLCRKADEHQIRVNSFCSSLRNPIKNEVPPGDKTGFKETLASMNDLMKLFQTTEVMLTVEQDLDQTIMNQYPEDSVLFQTILSNSSSVLENTIREETCSIEPKNVILTPPIKCEDILVLKSNCSRELEFSMRSEPEGLVLRPGNSRIKARETMILTVNVANNFREEITYKVLVSVENEVFQATVKTFYVHGQGDSDPTKICTYLRFIRLEEEFWIGSFNWFLKYGNQDCFWNGSDGFVMMKCLQEDVTPFPDELHWIRYF